MVCQLCIARGANKFRSILQEKVKDKREKKLLKEAKKFLKQSQLLPLLAQRQIHVLFHTRKITFQPTAELKGDSGAEEDAGLASDAQVTPQLLSAYDKELMVPQDACHVGAGGEDEFASCML